MSDSRGRPRVLFLCQTLPFPPDGGANIRSFNILKILAEEFEVDAVCFYRAADRTTGADVDRGIAGLAPFVNHVSVVPIPQESSRSRLLWDHARSLFLGRAYTMYAYRSPEARRQIKALCSSRRYDLIHMDSLDLVDFMPLFGDTPVACTHHNVESQLLARRARSESVAWRRAYVARQSVLLEREERKWCPRVAVNVAVSDRDAEELRQLAPSGRYLTVPNGVDVGVFEPGVGRDEGLVFVGGSNWFPNRDALEHFAADILPLLSESGRSVETTWIGRCSSEEQARYEGLGIHLTGYVDDIRPIVRDAAVYVAPLRVGGGTRLKILDAWAMGKAVVCTRIGCEGLQAVDGQNILIRDEPADFAEAIGDVLSDAELRRSLGKAARVTAEEIYSWPKIGVPLIATYRDVLGMGATAVGGSASPDPHVPPP